MESINVVELQDWRNSSKEHQLIDIREDHELVICQIDGEHIRMAEILDNLDKIRKDVPVVIHCRSGARSGAVVQELTSRGYDNLMNLEGGILAWIEQIDNSLEMY